MPELPDIELYLMLLDQRITGQSLVSLRVFNPFVLRSVSPSIHELEGREVVELRRLGKRVVICFSGQFFLVVHLMIAGRLRWLEGGGGDTRLGGKISMAALTFSNGTLFLTEAGTKKRASLTIVEGEPALAAQDPGGIDVLNCSLEEFHRALLSENHSIKDNLTNPHIFSGIGNAYSDEILHAARLSPIKRAKAISDDEVKRLYEEMRRVLNWWTVQLKSEFGNKFPGAGEITAFRPGFAVHGKFGQPCPVCGQPVQRIRYTENEANYCAKCQNGGKILADRAMSRLLKDDWPSKLGGT